MNSLGLSSSSRNTFELQARRGDDATCRAPSRRSYNRVSAYYDQVIIPGIKLSLRLSLRRSASRSLSRQVARAGAARRGMREKQISRGLRAAFFKCECVNKKLVSAARAYHVALKLPLYAQRRCNLKLYCGPAHVINFIDVAFTNYINDI